MERITQVGQTGDGIRCPKCGGSQFKTRRGAGRRVLAASTLVATPLIKQDQVQCVTCGAKFKRG